MLRGACTDNDVALRVAFPLSTGRPNSAILSAGLLSRYGLPGYTTVAITDEVLADRVTKAMRKLHHSVLVKNRQLLPIHVFIILNKALRPSSAVLTRDGTAKL